MTKIENLKNNESASPLLRGKAPGFSMNRTPDKYKQGILQSQLIFQVTKIVGEENSMLESESIQGIYIIPILNNI
jgi:hypothetical protein